MSGHALRLLAGFLLIAAAWPSPIASSTPYLSLKVVAKPNPVAPGVKVTFTGTVTPIGGAFHSVALQMGPIGLDGNDTCTPAANCSMDAVRKTVSWSMLEIASPMVVTATSTAPGSFVGFTVTYCDPNDCLVQNATVTVNGPTLGGNISFSPSGVVMPGDVLHFTVKGSANVGPVTGVDVQTKLPAGFGDPTHLSSGGVWNPSPYRYIDYMTDLNLTKTYTFDSAVTAPLGTNLNVTLICWWKSTKAFTKTITIHVGPVATATPRPTARPTPRATPKPPPATAAPTPAPTAALPSLIPTDTQMPSPMETISSSPSSSPSPTALQSSSAPSHSASAIPDNTSGPISLEGVILAGGAGGLGVAAWAGIMFVRRRRSLL